jgi:hypothetical protein
MNHQNQQRHYQPRQSRADTIAEAIMLWALLAFIFLPFALYATPF